MGLEGALLAARAVIESGEASEWCSRRLSAYSCPESPAFQRLVKATDGFMTESFRSTSTWRLSDFSAVSLYDGTLV